MLLFNLLKERHYCFFKALIKIVITWLFIPLMVYFPSQKKPTRAHGYIIYIIPLTVPRMTINDEQREEGTWRELSPHTFK